MKISALICEFSPFHFGHEYILRKMKETSDAVIAVMSGGFTERGEAGILSKYRRARAAIYGGADLVLELPFPFSACGAEKFALGGVSVADALGCVDELWCGSESGDAAQITQTAARLSTAEFKNALSFRISTTRGEPYADAYFNTYRALFGDSPLFQGSNDILALAYARTLVERGSRIKLRAVKRVGNAFSGGGGGFRSATELRKTILSGGDVSSFVPEYSAREIADATSSGEIYDTERLFLPLAGIFRIGNTSGFADAYESNDELYNRIKSAFADSTSLSEVIEKSVTKQYSSSRVRRAMIFSALGVTGWDVIQVYYTQVLAANQAGRDILKSIRKTAGIDIVTKPADCSLAAYSLSQRADALLALARRKAGAAGESTRASPIMI